MLIREAIFSSTGNDGLRLLDSIISGIYADDGGRCLLRDSGFLTPTLQQMSERLNFQCTIHMWRLERTKNSNSNGRTWLRYRR